MHFGTVNPPGLAQRRRRQRRRRRRRGWRARVAGRHSHRRRAHAPKPPCAPPGVGVGAGRRAAAWQAVGRARRGRAMMGDGTAPGLASTSMLSSAARGGGGNRRSMYRRRRRRPSRRSRSTRARRSRYISSTSSCSSSTSSTSMSGGSSSSRAEPSRGHDRNSRRLALRPRSPGNELRGLQPLRRPRQPCHHRLRARCGAAPASGWLSEPAHRSPRRARRECSAPPGAALTHGGG